MMVTKNITCGHIEMSSFAIIVPLLVVVVVVYGGGAFDRNLGPSG